jgi:hypothetical protein
MHSSCRRLFTFLGGGVQLIFHPSFMSELRLRSALPQHPLIVKEKDEVVLVYTMKLYRNRGSSSLALQPNSDLGRPIVAVSRSLTVRRTHTHTHTHIVGLP